MPNPARLDLTLTSGDDETIEFAMVDDAGTAIDLTGRTYDLEIRHDPADVAATCTFACTVPVPANGEITAFAATTQTDNMTPGKAYYWSLLETASGHVSTLITGRVSVLAQVTKP